MRKKALEIGKENEDEATDGVARNEVTSEGTASIIDGSEYPDGRIRILRVDDRSQKRVSHGYFPIDVTEEDISNAFGGGSYRAQLNSPDPVTGRVEIRKTRDFNIIGAYKPPQRISTFEDVGPNGPAATPAAAVAAASTPMMPGGGDDLMQVLKAGIINTLLEMMKSTKEMSRVPAGPDPILIRLMEEQSKTQQQMMQFMLTLATKDSGEGKDTLSMLAKMKEIVSPAGALAPGGAINPMEMFNTMLETFGRMREVADDLSPRREGGDPLMDSIPKLVEVVAEQHALNKAARNNVPRSASRPVPSGAAPVAEVHTIAEPQPENLAMWQMILRQQSTRLIAFATAKQDPDDIAAMAIIFAPANVKEALAIFFHRDEAAVAADILTEIPVLAEHREWLMDFIAAAQERLFPDEFADADANDGTTDGVEN